MYRPGGCEEGFLKQRDDVKSGPVVSIYVEGGLSDCIVSLWAEGVKEENETRGGSAAQG